ncbi:hypothetical protein BDV95DRAFT_589895 [Massariosphaeria phaeospora]|uniref:CENP-V/GFA domain-containing protein n=1 Tax=Massariosphaeria phaeospora TaxID=100035 RepID=A0A7C8MFY6_9PLEO|nr:hypothetical protein BDV95DRAFT_589895 [Massariosphaeria phaeospora]
MASSTSITLLAHCLCATHTFHTRIPPSSLPLPTSICHCTSCRLTTGALSTSATPWPTPRATVNTSALRTFAFSPRINVLFCGTCGSPLFFEFPLEKGARLSVVAGMVRVGRDGDGDEGCGFEDEDEGETDTGTEIETELLQSAKHICVGDTRDGGATLWAPRWDRRSGEEVPRFWGRSEGSAALGWDWLDEINTTRSEHGDQDEDADQDEDEKVLPIRCKCQGVNLRLHRGPASPTTTSTPPAKLRSISCSCRSCRLASGASTFHWAVAALSNISFATLSTFSSSASTSACPSTSTPAFPTSASALRAAVDASALGTLTYYASSPSTQRYFCRVCSASVFYASAERKGEVRVAIGVLGAGSGARAEGWVHWGGLEGDWYKNWDGYGHDAGVEKKKKQYARCGRTSKALMETRLDVDATA